MMTININRGNFRVFTNGILFVVKEFKSYTTGFFRWKKHHVGWVKCLKWDVTGGHRYGLNYGWVNAEFKSQKEAENFITKEIEDRRESIKYSTAPIRVCESLESAAV